MRLFPIIQRLHLWLGLVLGVQVLLWMASGVVMSMFDIALVRGETNAMSAPPVELAARGYANPGGVIAQLDGATSVRLKTFLDRAAYGVESANGSMLFDADTGARISPIAREIAGEIAKRDFVGAGEVGKIEYLTSAPGEYRRRLPVWRATMTDDLQTRIYISPETGEILSRRNKIWRLYDFFWMLHIMDYEERENFNNPLLKIAAISGALFAITGIYLVVVMLLKGKYGIGPMRPRAGNRSVGAVEEDG